MAEKLDIITVKSGLKNDRVAFYEGHRQHPNREEAFVAGDKPTKIAKTPGAVKALMSGDIVRVDEKEDEQVEDTTEPTAPEPEGSEPGGSKSADAPKDEDDTEDEGSPKPGALITSTDEGMLPVNKRPGRPARQQ